MSIRWECCPYCGESSDTERVGKPFHESVDREGKIHVSFNTLKRCGYCEKTWRSKEPTMLEAMGYDGEDEAAF